MAKQSNDDKTDTTVYMYGSTQDKFVYYLHMMIYREVTRSHLSLTKIFPNQQAPTLIHLLNLGIGYTPLL